MTHNPGPDFAPVDSLAKAVELYEQGVLEKLHLMPLEFGGEDEATNVLYVPVGVASVKHGIDVNVIGPLVDEGKVSQYRAEPEYQGDSFVPIAIRVTAWDPEEFRTTINIWGDALARDV
jgi:hypothetical protein